MVPGLHFRMLLQIRIGRIGRLMTGIGHGQTTTESEAYMTTVVVVAAGAPVTKVSFEHVNDCGTRLTFVVSRPETSSLGFSLGT
jgi:hypothetical protein